MNFFNYQSSGWKYNNCKPQAVINKRSPADFYISIIAAFFIIFVVSQILAHVDQAIRSPLAENKFSLINPLSINTACAANVEAKKMVQSQQNIIVQADSTSIITIGVKNLSSKTWQADGQGKVEIKIKKGNNLYQRGVLITADNKPGQIGYFNLTIVAPSNPGNYRYNYVLARNDTEVLAGSEFQLAMKIVKSKVAVTQPAVVNIVKTSEAPAKPQTQSVEQNNELTEEIKVGRMCLNYSSQKFLLTPEMQKIIDQCKKIGVDLTPNIFIDPDSRTASGSNADNQPADVISNTTANPIANNVSSVISSLGPLVRIGLYNTTAPIIITANGNYNIKDQNQNILGFAPANSQTTATFNFANQTYNINANGASFSTSSYLRFEGENPDTIFEIVSLDLRPAWNQSLNDNRYAGVLEIRYALPTGKLWVINELPMENYLKGLAESSNNSPMEYQKALVTAARTYAMYHYNRGTKHAAENFTLDANFDQVYRGYNSQLRLTQVVAAVEATNGQVVTYNNEVVVTPYFSYSDGQTRNWQDVWGGAAKPWCVAVKEPAGYTKTTLYGHGVGMSAYGAMLLANNYNYTFDQILKYYYTGVELKKAY